MPQETLTLFLSVFVATILTFLAVWYFATTVLARRREEMRRRLGLEELEPSLLLPAPETGLARRFDLGFNHMIARTGLDLDPALALGIILFSGVVFATATFIWRMDEEAWLAIPAFFFGAAIPLVF